MKVRRWAFGLVAIVTLGGADMCGETQTPAATAASESASMNSDGEEYVEVALDENSDGAPDDTDQNSTPDHKGKAKKKWLLECGIGLGVCAAGGGWWCAAGAAFNCLKAKGMFES